MPYTIESLHSGGLQHLPQPQCTSCPLSFIQCWSPGVPDNVWGVSGGGFKLCWPPGIFIFLHSRRGKLTSDTSVPGDLTQEHPMACASRHSPEWARIKAQMGRLAQEPKLACNWVSTEGEHLGNTWVGFKINNWNFKAVSMAPDPQCRYDSTQQQYPWQWVSTGLGEEILRTTPRNFSFKDWNVM